MTVMKFHTVLCERRCFIVHHDLLSALLGGDQRGTSSIQLVKCVETHVNNGWAKDSDVPDESEQLRQPLLFLAAAFGKRRFLELLMQFGFDVSVRNRAGETVIHGAVRLLYKCYICTYWITKKKLLDSIISIMITRNSYLILSKDNQNQTALHVAARFLAETSPKGFGRWNNAGRVCGKVCFYQDAMESMIRKIDGLEKSGSLAREHVIEALNARDCKGDTIFDILRNSCNKQSLDMIGYICTTFSDFELSVGNKRVMELTASPQETRPASPVEIVSALNSVFDETTDSENSILDKDCRSNNIQEKNQIIIDGDESLSESSSTSAEASTKTSLFRSAADVKESVEDDSLGEVHDTSQNPHRYHSNTSTASLNQQQVKCIGGKSQDESLQHDRQHTEDFSMLTPMQSSEIKEDPQLQKQSCQPGEKCSSDPVIIHVDSLSVCYNGNCERSEMTHNSHSQHDNLSSSQSLREDQEMQHLIANISGVATPQLKKKQEFGSRLLSSEIPLVYSMITEDSSLDNEGKCNVLGVFQQEYQRKMIRVEASVPQVESDISAINADIAEKKERVNILQCELAQLQRDIEVLSDAAKEKQKKRNLLYDEKETLSKRIKHCQEMKIEFEGRMLASEFPSDLSNQKLE